MAVRARLVVHGRVQGVWYRGSMQTEATRLAVGGWVRNQPDGTVEAEVEGETAAVEALIAWARCGPSGARVTEIAVEWLVAGGERGRFVVRG
jgi:acylphosphatase